MKVIDLLNKIANGEEVPEKFRFAGQIFEKQGSYIEDEDGDSIFESIFTDFSNINDEVEIIEENNKIEKLDSWTVSVGRVDERNIEEYIHKLFRQQFEIFNKLNEIIDEINKIKKD